MHQIVYTSTASEDFSTADLNRLLLGARTRNKALGVSGMLVFHGGTFLQALESEQRAVNEIFASIASDRRHRYSQRLRASQRTTAHRGTRWLAGNGTARHLRGRGRDQERWRLVEHPPPNTGVPGARNLARDRRIGYNVFGFSHRAHTTDGLTWLTSHTRSSATKMA